MWKLIVGFVIFGALALFMLKKMGSGVDISGEKHGVETSEAVPAASAPASAAMPASAASN